MYEKPDLYEMIKNQEKRNDLHLKFNMHKNVLTSYIPFKNVLNKYKNIKVIQHIDDPNEISFKKIVNRTIEYSDYFYNTRKIDKISLIFFYYFFYKRLFDHGLVEKKYDLTLGISAIHGDVNTKDYNYRLEICKKLQQNYCNSEKK